MAGKTRKFLDNKAYRDWNESMAKRFDPELFYSCENSLVRKLEKDRLKSVVRLLSYSKEEKLLDVGCGSGKLEESLGEAQAIGVDISDHLLAKAKARINFIIKAHAEFLPFKDKIFDKVACTEVIEHVINPESIIGEISRVLKSEGVAVFSIPNENFINIAKKIYSTVFFWRKKSPDGYIIPNKMEDHWHIHSFNLKLFRKMSRDALSIKKIEYLPNCFFPLRYVVKCCKKKLKSKTNE